MDRSPICWTAARGSSVVSTNNGSSTACSNADCQPVTLEWLYRVRSQSRDRTCGCSLAGSGGSLRIASAMRTKSRRSVASRSDHQSAGSLNDPPIERRANSGHSNTFINAPIGGRACVAKPSTTSRTAKRNSSSSTAAAGRLDRCSARFTRSSMPQSSNAALSSRRSCRPSVSPESANRISSSTILIGEAAYGTRWRR